MKKLIITGLIVTTALASCQKKYCWKCVMYHANAWGTGLDLTNPENTMQCDMTKSEISDFEKSNSIQITIKSNQKNYIEETQCTQQ